MSQDQPTKDSKGRLIKLGCHRDIESFNPEYMEGTMASAMNSDVFLSDRNSSSTTKRVPMTNFQWKIAHMLVTTIPNDIQERNEKYKYVAGVLKVQSDKIALQKEQDYLARLDKEREMQEAIELQKEQLLVNSHPELP